MYKLHGIGVENLRALQQPDPIDLKRITVLVGKNSAGKSSFARIFPLLRQSIDTQRRSPVLWYGRIVDFGSFDDVCNRSNPDHPIKFKFRFRADSPSRRSALSTVFFDRGGDRQQVADGVMVDAIVSISRGNEGSYASSVSLTVDEFKGEVQFDQNGWVTSISSGSYKWSPISNLHGFGNEGRLIPNVLIVKAVGDGDSLRYELVQRPFFDHVKTSLKSFVHGNTRENTLFSIATSLPLGSPETLRQALADEVKRRKLTHYLGPAFGSSNEPRFRRLGEALLLFRFASILDMLESSLKEYFSGVRYLAPLRATAQRFYREQELAVDEIDPQGENIANVISSLSSFDRERLDEWTRRHLGFTVEAVRSGGHVSLKIKQDESSEATNLADMGFGFSQVLPIPLQLWLSVRELGSSPRLSKGKKSRCIVIEQPELHLHPDFQAKLANLFAGIASVADGEPPHLVIETHSPAMINRFGELVQQGKIDRNEIQILLFEPSGTAQQTTVRTANFDGDGVLENWPFGFFEPGYD